MERKIQVAELFAYRNVWMGIAILWIVLYHSGFVIKNEVLLLIKRMGYGGVDIFLFASGIGCYYSLEKNSDILQFLKRRFIKIMPAYWIFMIIWTVFKIFTDGISVNAIIGNFLCVQSITGLDDSFNWYMCAIWILYFLAPYIKGIIDRMKTSRGLLLLIIGLLIFTVPFWGVRSFIIVVTRIPIFVIGMYFAKLGKKGEGISLKISFCLMAMFVIGVYLYKVFFKHFREQLWDYGLYWYPFILITPGLCLIIALVFKYLKLGAIEKVLSAFGKNSFEIFLIHIFLFNIYAFLEKAEYIQNSNMNRLITILFIAPCCILFKFGVKKSVGMISKYILHVRS